MHASLLVLVPASKTASVKANRLYTRFCDHLRAEQKMEINNDSTHLMSTTSPFRNVLMSWYARMHCWSLRAEMPFFHHSPELNEEPKLSSSFSLSLQHLLKKTTFSHQPLLPHLRTRTHPHFPANAPPAPPPHPPQHAEDAHHLPAHLPTQPRAPLPRLGAALGNSSPAVRLLGVLAVPAPSLVCRRFRAPAAPLRVVPSLHGLLGFRVVRQDGEQLQEV